MTALDNEFDPWRRDIDDDDDEKDGSLKLDERNIKLDDEFDAISVCLFYNMRKEGNENSLWLWECEKERRETRHPDIIRPAKRDFERKDGRNW